MRTICVKALIYAVQVCPPKGGCWREHHQPPPPPHSCTSSARFERHHTKVKWHNMTSPTHCSASTSRSGAVREWFECSPSARGGSPAHRRRWCHLHLQLCKVLANRRELRPCMYEGCPLFPQNGVRLPDCSQEATERAMACLPMRMLVGMTAMACTIAMAVGAPRVTTAPAPAGFDCKTRHLAMEFGKLNSTPPYSCPCTHAFRYAPHQWCAICLERVSCHLSPRVALCCA